MAALEKLWFVSVDDHEPEEWSSACEPRLTSADGHDRGQTAGATLVCPPKSMQTKL